MSNDDTLKKYERSSLRFALELIAPFLGPATGVLSSRKQAQNRQRAEEMLEDLSNDMVSLNDEMVQNDDFVHAFSIVTSAVVRTRHREKRRLFARLLAIYAKHGDFGDEKANVFEEDYQILDELGPREFMVIAILAKYDRDAREADVGATLVMLNRVWDEFSAEVEEKVGISSYELSSFLSRIGRTGLYKELTGSYFDYTGGKGTTTPLFERLSRNLELNNYRLLG